MGKIIIFSTATGGGHNQTAEVLSSELRLACHDVEIIDYIQASSQFLDMIINGGYNHVLSKTGKTYGLLYSTSQRVPVNNSVSYILKGFLARHIRTLAEEKQADLIISTHPLIVKTLGDMKQTGKLDTPVMSVITDFEAHRFYVHPRIDAYVVPSRHTGENLCSYGISPTKIHINGIPVRSEFFERSMRKRSSTFTALVMAGTHSSSELLDVLEQMVITDEKLNIIAVCGTNDRLRERLENRFNCLPDNINLEICGYIKEIASAMDRAHVVITKPGGITVSEAINKAVPLVIPFWITGQEEENLRFLVDKGVAIGIEDNQNIEAVISILIHEPHHLKRMENQMRLLAVGYSNERTIKLAERLMAEKLAHRKTMII